MKGCRLFVNHFMKTQKINIEEIKGEKNPLFSIITPLKTNHTISYNTFTSVLRANLPFEWFYVQSDNNTMKNYELGLDVISKQSKYIIKIDNDTTWEENTLENMYNTIEASPSNIGYVYCGFEFYGTINNKFPLMEFNERKLKEGNYISSNSMFKKSVINHVKLVTEDKYKRLLDWAFLLKCLKSGYIGQGCEGWFKAETSVNSISAASMENYQIKHDLVLKDFG